MKSKEEAMRLFASTKPKATQDAPEMLTWLKEQLHLEVMFDIRDAVVALKTEKK